MTGESHSGQKFTADHIFIGLPSTYSGSWREPWMRNRLLFREHLLPAPKQRPLQTGWRLCIKRLAFEVTGLLNLEWSSNDVLKSQKNFVPRHSIETQKRFHLLLVRVERFQRNP